MSLKTFIYSFSHVSINEDSTKLLHIWTQIIYQNLAFPLYNYLCASIMDKTMRKGQTPDEIRKFLVFKDRAEFLVQSTCFRIALFKNLMTAKINYCTSQYCWRNLEYIYIYKNLFSFIVETYCSFCAFGLFE